MAWFSVKLLDIRKIAPSNSIFQDGVGDFSGNFSDFGVDFENVWRVIKEDIINLKNKITKIKEELKRDEGRNVI